MIKYLSLLTLLIVITTQSGCGALVVGAIAEDAARQGARKGVQEQQQEIEQLKEEIKQLKDQHNQTEREVQAQP